ncbi:MAG: hypothetical protein ABR555_12660 [Pyrinomonadaceae bacterium]
MASFLSGIALIAIVGLGVMLAGALTLKKDGGFGEEFIGFFLFLVFVIVGSTEVFLIRQLSRLTSGKQQDKTFAVPKHQPYELRPATAAAFLGEPVASVTENTTRTLGNARREEKGN